MNFLTFLKGLGASLEPIAADVINETEQAAIAELNALISKWIPKLPTPTASTTV